MQVVRCESIRLIKEKQQKRCAVYAEKMRLAVENEKKGKQ